MVIFRLKIWACHFKINIFLILKWNLGKKHQIMLLSNFRKNSISLEREVKRLKKSHENKHKPIHKETAKGIDLTFYIYLIKDITLVKNSRWKFFKIIKKNILLLIMTRYELSTCNSAYATTLTLIVGGYFVLFLSQTSTSLWPFYQSPFTGSWASIFWDL